MCLREVTSTTRDRKREGFGWKVFNIRDGKIYSECMSRKKAKKEGVWLKSQDNGKALYPLGFHVFRTRKAARSWKNIDSAVGSRVRKVRWRDFLAEGLQWGSPAIVAKEMMILES